MVRRLLPLIWNARKQVKLTWFLISDKRVPLWQKAIPFLPLVYILSPLNLLSLAVPVLGQVDDVVVVLMAMELLERLVDKDILADYKDTDV